MTEALTLHAYELETRQQDVLLTVLANLETNHIVITVHDTELKKKREDAIHEPKRKHPGKI